MNKKIYLKYQMKLISFVYICFYSLSALSEYRVFTLQISSQNSNEVIQFDSTLDPEQYKNFYTLKSTNSITYINTWRCPGNTSQHRPLCSQEVDF